MMTNTQANPNTARRTRFASTTLGALALAGMMLGSQPASAKAKTKPTWTNFTKVIQLQSQSHFTVNVPGTIEGTTSTNPHGCKDAQWYGIHVNDKRHQAKVDLLTTAFRANAQVSFLLNGCLADNPRIFAVRIKWK